MQERLLKLMQIESISVQEKLLKHSIKELHIYNRSSQFRVSLALQQKRLRST